MSQALGYKDENNINLILSGKMKRAGLTQELMRPMMKVVHNESWLFTFHMFKVIFLLGQDYLI